MTVPFPERKIMAKTTYTYEDFLQKAKTTGLLQSFSPGDMRLAQENPDAGMSILSYKMDYAKASTDEARALANAGAEKIRSTYGGYTAGLAGDGYYLNEGLMENKSYVNQYGDEQQRLVSALQGDFSYESHADPLWQDYRKAYLREGERAYADALGDAAANTGGIASTAAVTAAQQARNYYNAQAADQRAALYQQAYENYLAARNQAVTELGAYDALNQTAAAQHEQKYADAIDLWKAYGYVTEGIADTLGLPAGTMYSDTAYNAWYQAFQEAQSGVYTGQTIAGKNPGPDAQTGANPAAGDSAANHATLRRGSSGGDVTVMQRYLIALGYHCGDRGEDGVFGADTRSAVRAFQKDYGLKVDGVCGPKTWGALIAALASA